MIKNQLKFRGKNSIAIYGITRNPTENEYMMVINYAKYGSLQRVLNTKFKKLTWRRKSYIYYLLVGKLQGHLPSLTDFGLSKLVTDNNPENIYDIIPYMAHETLHRGEYIQASDIYSFEIMEKCWNFESLNRPTAKKLESQLSKYLYDFKLEAIYTSRHLSFVKSKKFETHDKTQWDLVIPEAIIEENEIQEN
ncbi:hypothetical protein Glove_228g111 [Diversispora epigaea]|uniref:Serine-threonine/tyrosine-protein kinase catalytic domain-containing protein n=1 Tax=Diversispora epigaea TaxID=1348612 RepID=A0A397IKZ4_9GLOM|nr:hypothetical protein Glove_228g111 [Diversispora epigaea]